MKILIDVAPSEQGLRNARKSSVASSCSTGHGHPVQETVFYPRALRNDEDDMGDVQSLQRPQIEMGDVYQMGDRGV